jgi:cytidine deaminase
MVGLHAELNVCMKSGKEDLRDFKMVVLWVDRTGKLNNSKPCCGCQSVIKQFNVGEVWYSDAKGEIVKQNWKKSFPKKIFDFDRVSG